MSQNQYYQQNYSFNPSAVPASDLNHLNLNLNLTAQQEELDVNTSNDSRRDVTQHQIQRLYQLTSVSGHNERNIPRAGGHINKNEILGLSLVRLVKEKHFTGKYLSRDLELTRGIQLKSNNGNFIIVLRTDGRVVAISDEVETQLGKKMRSIYTQCINMYECLNEADGEKLKSILDKSDDINQNDHKLVCDFRLPKGKRPSRVREDIKAITMTGHFYTCNDAMTGSNEKLFIARCEVLSTQTTKKPTTNSTDSTGSVIKIVLNEDMSINSVSSNVPEILGYSKKEMTDNWFGRYLTSDGLEKFEHIRQKYFSNAADQQPPASVCDILNMYGKNGEHCLTFLCQIRSNRQRKSPAVNLSITAQLIDPSLNDEYMKYVQIESESMMKSSKAEQVNHVSSISKTSEDAIMANSPSLDMGLLIDDFTFTNQHQFSPIHRSLSDVVAPFNQHDDAWTDFLALDFNEYSTGSTDFNCWSKSDDQLISDGELDHLLEQIMQGY